MYQPTFARIAQGASNNLSIDTAAMSYLWSPHLKFIQIVQAMAVTLTLTVTIQSNSTWAISGVVLKQSTEELLGGLFLVRTFGSLGISRKTMQNDVV